MNHITEIFSRGLEAIQENGKNHKDGLKELRDNQIIISGKVDELAYIVKNKK